MRAGEKAVIHGTIRGVEFRPQRSRWKGILRVEVADGTGGISLVWFNASPGWRSSFPEGQQITAFGTLAFYGGLQIVAPDYHVGAGPADSDKFGRVLPIYPLTEGLSQGVMRNVVAAAVELGADAMPEVLPRAVCRERRLPSAARAVREVHFPECPERARAARRRLAYEELFVFQAALALRRIARRQAGGVSFRVGPNVDRRIRRLFPFPFTGAQDRAVAEVAADMRAERPMNRLLQGDVGCGKTVVALYAMLAALAESSKRRQVAMMAPTEVLAEQHYLNLRSLLERARVRTLLLSGGAPREERRANLSKLARGEVGLVVGTHALIQSDVEFRNLALVVVDEQHRFGVRQRLALREKGPPPDTLIMTATPIPRTLAMAYLADMDVSVIDQMPPGRRPVETELRLPAAWDGAFEAAREELRAGRRAFVVYPLVEESRELDLTSAREGYERLSREVFPGYACCLLHGQMPAHQKQRVMEDFRSGRAQVMAATTVIEVGIDVPEATVMIVQHAERLGLAQLHQLRGRIGRGEHPGRCFLLAEPTTEEARRRLEVLTETSDGFRIAEEDLRLRGPGQLLGVRQSGMPEFRCYDFSDPEVLKEAHEDAMRLVRSDPGLARPESALLRRAVIERHGEGLELADVG